MTIQNYSKVSTAKDKCKVAYMLYTHTPTHTYIEENLEEMFP